LRFLRGFRVLALSGACWTVTPALQKRCACIQQPAQFCFRLDPLIRIQVTVGIRGQCNGGVPHYRLDHIQVDPPQRQPGAAGMPQAVEVQLLPVVIGSQQEIGLLPPYVFSRIALGFL
jgi:hypothetical protein